MTEPVKPKMNITFGGVRFNANDIEKKEKKFNEQNAIYYSVFLKNGVSIEYPEQNRRNDASIRIFGDNNDATAITSLAHGNVKGSPKKDHIQLIGNNGTTVDVSGDNIQNSVITYGRTFGHKHCSKGNKVIMDSKDHTNFNRFGNSIEESKEVVVEGEGIADENSHMYY